MSDDDGRKGSDMLRHPLVIVLVTFALTGIVGAVFSHWLSKRQSEVTRLRVETEARKDAVQKFSRYVYERRARAEMLTSSFRRNAPLDEIRERKKFYDDVYVDWNSNHQANLFLIRDVLQADQYSLFENVVEFVLVGKIFAPLDACLTEAYDTRLKDGDAIKILDQCQARGLLRQALDCGYAITDELYKLSAGATDQTRAANEIYSRCPR